MGRKYLALYLLAQSLAVGYEMETSLSLSSRVFNVAEVTLQKCWSAWKRSDDAFTASLRGKHAKHQWLLASVPMQEACKQYIRTTATKRGDERFTPQKFKKWLNNSDEVHKLMGWDGVLPRPEPRKLGIRTANRYISKLGFYKKFAKKGEFFDKHDDKAIVDDRERYLAEKKIHDLLTWRKLPHFDDPAALEAHLKELADGPAANRPYVELVNDETACNANDTVNHQYTEKGKNAYIRSKSKGAGIMVGAYITEVFGRILQHDGKMAAASLEYGNGRWWNSRRMLKHLKEVIEIRKKRLPWARVIWRFDHSTNHTAKCTTALNVYQMNIGFGGKKPVMRDTTVLDKGSLLYNQVQRMVLEQGDLDEKGKPIKDELIGKPKGLKRVLDERWGPEVAKQFTGKQRKQQLQKRLGEDLDFQLQTTLIHDLIKKLCPNDLVRFYPKYHCEFPAIERYWCDHKTYCRTYCRYNIKGLRKVVPQGLDAVCADSVRRYFGLCRRYEVAYRKEVSTQDIYRVVKHYTAHRKPKEYSSHRRVLDGTGVVERLKSSGVLVDADFVGLCSCSRCDTMQVQICEQPRCVHHGIEARGGRKLTDADVPTMGYLKNDAAGDDEPEPAVGVAAAPADDEAELKEVDPEEVDSADEDPGDDIIDDSGDDIGEVLAPCTRPKCRKWRTVEKEWLDDKRADSEFMFTCRDANKQCRAQCAGCGQRSQCTCTCPECAQDGSACWCQAFE